MPSIADTIARLSANVPAPAAARQGRDRLSDLVDFGSDPGALRARCYVPVGLPAGAALVVALHGCTQDAAAYDHGAGWSRLADAHGFAVLLPEQRRSNNPNLCFNWFAAADTRRDAGEASSMRQMIATMIVRHTLNAQRVFVTGLSAGGAMAATLLATYPEVFAGGAIIAGLPHGVATSVGQAMERMRGSGLPDAAALTAAVHHASPHAGPWPRVAVWHGSADATVSPASGEAVVAQWRGVHGLGAAPDHVATIDGATRRVWRSPDGGTAVEAWTVPGLGHGTPVASAEGVGAAGPHMLEAGISSTLHIAESWGLASRMDKRSGSAPSARVAPPTPIPIPTPPRGPAQMIEHALRSAGLLR